MWVYYFHCPVSVSVRLAKSDVDVDVDAPRWLSVASVLTAQQRHFQLICAARSIAQHAKLKNLPLSRPEKVLKIKNSPLMCLKRAEWAPNH